MYFLWKRRSFQINSTPGRGRIENPLFWPRDANEINTSRKDDFRANNSAFKQCSQYFRLGNLSNRTDHPFVEELLYPRVARRCANIISTLQNNVFEYSTPMREKIVPDLTSSEFSRLHKCFQDYKIDIDLLKEVERNENKNVLEEHSIGHLKKSTMPKDLTVAGFVQKGHGFKLTHDYSTKKPSIISDKTSQGVKPLPPKSTVTELKNSSKAELLDYYGGSSNPKVCVEAIIAGFSKLYGPESQEALDIIKTSPDENAPMSEFTDFFKLQKK